MCKFDAEYFCKLGEQISLSPNIQVLQRLQDTITDLQPLLKELMKEGVECEIHYSNADMIPLSDLNMGSIEDDNQTKLQEINNNTVLKITTK